MRITDTLEPKSVLSYFADLCAIPHGSGNTKAISDYCVRFAESHGFEVHQDALNNVIIICPATPGCESAEPVIIQGHLDMVTSRWTATISTPAARRSAATTASRSRWRSLRWMTKRSAIRASRPFLRSTKRSAWRARRVSTSRRSRRGGF